MLCKRALDNVELDWYETNLWLLGFKKGHTPSVWYDGFGNSLVPIQTSELEDNIIVQHMTQAEMAKALEIGATDTPFILSDEEYV